MFFTETFSSKKFNITLLNSNGLQLIFESMKSLTTIGGVVGNMEYFLFFVLHFCIYFQLPINHA